VLRMNKASSTSLAPFNLIRIASSTPAALNMARKGARRTQINVAIVELEKIVLN
jgi:hypothetical protein